MTRHSADLFIRGLVVGLSNTLRLPVIYPLLVDVKLPESFSSRSNKLLHFRQVDWYYYSARNRTLSQQLRTLEG